MGAPSSTPRPPTKPILKNSTDGSACGGARAHARTGFGCSSAHWAWPGGPATSASETPAPALGGVGARKGPLHRPGHVFTYV